MNDLMLEPTIYRMRFSESDIEMQRRLWRPICRYLQQFVAAQGTTLDLGAGSCHFINNIDSRQKVAVDINPEGLERFADRQVRRIVSDGADLGVVESNSIDTVFASNVYEHFPSRECVARSLGEVYRVLKPSGTFVILQPNFAHCYREYFDFFDHRLAFSHRGMQEGLEIAGFEIRKVTARFLPYTTKKSLPKWPWLVALYLRVPLAWRVFGAQMLLVARKPDHA